MIDVVQPIAGLRATQFGAQMGSSALQHLVTASTEYSTCNTFAGRPDATCSVGALPGLILQSHMRAVILAETPWF